jgi:hypothetical protein
VGGLAKFLGAQDRHFIYEEPVGTARVVQDELNPPWKAVIDETNDLDCYGWHAR